MQLESVLLIILAVGISLALVVYQYRKLVFKDRKLYLPLMILRFLAVFGILLLLINPKITRESYVLEKSDLVLLTDNSSSIGYSESSDQLQSLLNELKSNEELRNKFNIHQLAFGRELNTSDSLSFSEEVTDIHNALNKVDRSFTRRNAAVLLLSDGNQTIGPDYEYFRPGQGHSLFPLVVGDTTSYEDVLIEQLNVNKYAFLDNQYPVEVLVSYHGEGEHQIPLTLRVDGTIRHRETVGLSKRNNSSSITILLRANEVGSKILEVELGQFENEKNTSNNRYTEAVEVIDEKTSVVIVSDIKHPDLGVLRKSIETNKQRTVSVLRPNEAVNGGLQEADVLILYQPTRSFQGVYGIIDQRNIGHWTITGPHTDWTFLNRVQTSYQKESFSQTEEVTPVLNSGFATFDVSGYTMDNFPPLITSLGDIVFTEPYESIIEQRIRGVELESPLLAVINSDSKKEAILFGENLWKWRMQTYRNNRDFSDFDKFISKVILYLTTDNTRQRLSLEYDNIFRDAKQARIRASYFDETFEFDDNATITIFISGRENAISREFPMLLKGNFYEADLSGLPSGNFDFTVRVENKNIMRSGQFSILDFDVEKQFLSSDYEKLGRLASGSGGKSYFPSGIAGLISDLIADPRYKPTQKSEQNIVSLIDFKVLLALIIGAFTAEWLIRKYNGLI